MDLLFIKETLEHSTGEKRTQEVLEAIKYELEHQHDIDKAKARSTIQQ